MSARSAQFSFGRRGCRRCRTASYGRVPGRATLLVKAMDRILGTHTCKKTAFFGMSEIT
jgi:hypothetical protein